MRKAEAIELEKLKQAMKNLEQNPSVKEYTAWERLPSPEKAVPSAQWSRYYAEVRSYGFHDLLKKQSDCLHGKDRAGMIQYAKLIKEARRAFDSQFPEPRMEDGRWISSHSAVKSYQNVSKKIDELLTGKPTDEMAGAIFS